MTSTKRRSFQTEIELIPGETWVPIFRNYSVSNMGRIKSCAWGYDVLLRTYKNNRNYDCVDIRINGKTKKSTVHKLVAMVFVNNIDPKRITVNHKNGKDDNRAESLEWMTYSENSKHGADNDLLQRGVRHYAAQLDEWQIRTIKSIGDELSRADVGRYFKVKPSYVSNVVRGKSWKHITV